MKITVLENNSTFIVDLDGRSVQVEEDGPLYTLEQFNDIHFIVNGLFDRFSDYKPVAKKGK